MTNKSFLESLKTVLQCILFILNLLMFNLKTQCFNYRLYMCRTECLKNYRHVVFFFKLKITKNEYAGLNKTTIKKKFQQYFHCVFVLNQYQNFVLIETNFFSAEWYIQYSMTWLNLCKNHQMRYFINRIECKTRN